MEMVVQHYPTDFKAMAEYYGMREFLLENAGKSGAQVIVEADADMIAQYRRRRKVEIAVARAIREKGFLVYYQPVYSLKERSAMAISSISGNRCWSSAAGFFQSMCSRTARLESVRSM